MNKPIRLFWGENYSKKPLAVINAIRQAFKEYEKAVNLYPGSLYQATIDKTAKLLKVKPNQVIFGHGIEGLVHLISQTFLTKDNVGGMFMPSFYVYADNLSRYKLITFHVHYSKKVNVENLLKTIAKTSIFFLANPNTATGNYLLDKNQIEHILQRYKGILIVDECYFGMGNITVVNLIEKYENLIVLRTPSKVMGIPSIRLGIGITNEKNIKRLEYNQNVLEADFMNTFSLLVFKIPSDILPCLQILQINLLRSLLILCLENLMKLNFYPH